MSECGDCCAQCCTDCCGKGDCVDCCVNECCEIDCVDSCVDNCVDCCTCTNINSTLAIFLCFKHQNQKNKYTSSDTQKKKKAPESFEMNRINF